MNYDNFEDCSVRSNNPIVTVSECACSFEIKNPDKIIINKVKIDGCVIRDERERCDYLFEIGSPTHCVIYLELKGCHVEKAFSQLVSTLGYFKHQHSSLNRFCHIVASRVPRATTGTQAMKVKMAQKHKAILFIGTTKTSIILSALPYQNLQSAEGAIE